MKGGKGRHWRKLYESFMIGAYESFVQSEEGHIYIL